MRGREDMRPASLVEFRPGNNRNPKPRLEEGSQWVGKFQEPCRVGVLCVSASLISHIYYFLLHDQEEEAEK